MASITDLYNNLEG